MKQTSLYTAVLAGAALLASGCGPSESKLESLVQPVQVPASAMKPSSGMEMDFPLIAEILPETPATRERYDTLKGLSDGQFVMAYDSSRSANTLNRATGQMESPRAYLTRTITPSLLPGQELRFKEAQDANGRYTNDVIVSKVYTTK